MREQACAAERRESAVGLSSVRSPQRRKKLLLCSENFRAKVERRPNAAYAVWFANVNVTSNDRYC